MSATILPQPDRYERSTLSKNPSKFVFLIRNRAGLCTFVHGVSVGFLVGSEKQKAPASTSANRSSDLIEVSMQEPQSLVRIYADHNFRHNQPPFRRDGHTLLFGQCTARRLRYGANSRVLWIDRLQLYGRVHRTRDIGARSPTLITRGMPWIANPAD